MLSISLLFHLLPPLPHLAIIHYPNVQGSLRSVIHFKPSIYLAIHLLRFFTPFLSQIAIILEVTPLEVNSRFQFKYHKVTALYSLPLQISSSPSSSSTYHSEGCQRTSRSRSLCILLRPTGKGGRGLSKQQSSPRSTLVQDDTHYSNHSIPHPTHPPQ